MKRSFFLLLLAFFGFSVVQAQSEEHITINDNAICTNNLEHKVILTLRGAGAKEMMISDDVAFGGAKWEPFKTKKEWKLKGADGEKKLYAKFKYEGKQESQRPVEASILLDTHPPIHQGNVVVNSGETLTDSFDVLLHFNTKDAAFMWISNSPKFDDETAWEAFNDKKEWTLSPKLGLKTVYAKFKDECGNESRPVTGKITIK